MTILSLGEAIPDLKKYYRQKRLIPFLGAGFSVPLGLPSWSELIGWLATQLGFEEDLFTLHGNHQQLAEYAQLNGRRIWQDLLNKMTREFDSAEAVRKRQVSIMHLALGSLDWNTIYTTNYDSHIEGALSDHGKKNIALASLADFLEPRESGICEVIKFHGTLKDHETIILTESRYFDRMSLEEAVDQRLRADLLSNSFLFVGYGFNDPNIRYIWYRIHKLREQQRLDPSISLKPGYFATFGADPVQPRLLEKWNIHVISLDPEDKSKSVSELFYALGQN